MKNILTEKIRFAKEAILRAEKENDRAFPETGFLITIDPTTGSGKTFASVGAVAEILEDEEENNVPEKERTRFLFITEYKNNVRDPQADLTQRLKQGQYPGLVDKLAFLDANTELMKREKAKGLPMVNWVSTAIQQNNCPLSGNIEAINALETMKTCVKKLQNDTPNKAEYEELLSRNESIFRSKLRYELNRYCSKHFFGTDNSKKVKEKHRRLALEEKEWSWIAELYPTVNAMRKYALFMSTAKMMYAIDPIVAPSFSLWETRPEQRYVVVLDEYDSNMSAINQQIIKSTLKDNYELLDTVKSIGSCLKTDGVKLCDEVFERGWLKSLDDVQKGYLQEHSLIEMLEAFNQVYEQYNLYVDFDFQDMDKFKDQFLFHDLEDCMFINDDAANSYVIPAGKEHGNENKLNTIVHLSKEQLAEKEASGAHVYRLTMLFGQMNGLVAMSVSRLSKLASKMYANATNVAEYKGYDGEALFEVYPEESYFQGLLQRFSITDGERFKPASAMNSMRVAMNVRGFGKTGRSLSRDRSMYANGFKLMQLTPPQDPHTLTTWFRTYAVATSPENILLGLVRNNYIVIGLSATANLETVIGNFDDNYVSAVLGNKRLRLTEEEQEQLNELVRQSQSHYDRIHIETTLVSATVPETGEYGATLWYNVFKNKVRADKAHAIVSMPKGKSFDAQRCYKAAWAYRYFMEHDDMRSFLFYTNKALKDGDGLFRPDVMLSLFALIEEELALDRGEAIDASTPAARQAHENTMRKRAEDHMAVLYGSGEVFDKRRANIIKRWEKGDKLFVLTPFASTATGQNLQYTIPEQLLKEGQVVCVNDWTPNSKKDVDGIFVDKPTNMVVDLTRQMSYEGRQEARIAALIEIERLYEHGELSPRQKHAMVAAVCGIVTGETKEDKELGFKARGRYKTYSAYAARLRLVLQAVGRMCRTNMKSRTVHILADADVLKDVPRSTVARMNTVLNREFEALLRACNLFGEDKKDDRIKGLESAAAHSNTRTLSSIRSMLNNDFATEQDQKEWEDIRERALMTPTVAKTVCDQFTRVYMMNTPTPTSKYYYREIADFEKTDIFFDRPQEWAHIACAERTGLNEMLLVPGVRDFMIANGYATEWVPGDKILTPAAIRNIYKGALGEKIGQFVIESATMHDITCARIDKQGGYEKMDAELVYQGERSNVYIDFKNWLGETMYPGYEEEMINKFVQKLAKLGTTKGVVANVILPNSSKPAPRILDKNEYSILLIPALAVPEGEIYAPYEPALMALRRFL